MSWQPNLSYGNRGDYFGGQDYFRGLKQIWDAEGASQDRQRKLMDYRSKVLDWMGKDENINKIHSSNRLGAGSGMGHDIATGDHTWAFQGVGRGTITDAEGNTRDTRSESANWYGGADLMAARAAGHGWGDIKTYLDQNQSRLRLGNVKGAGGVYDQVASEARLEAQDRDWTSKLGGLQESFDEGMQEHTDQLSGAFETGMGGVSDAITAQTEAEQKYRADQANWQRRQENMQQMMIQEGRRKAREKPVMAVMPGASSYGGGGGGAAAFARKKKQTTGLNIA